MNAVVFLGPTISPEVARQELDAEFVGPAVQGDVYLAACRRPLAIGIVDGLFERVPSVWHKEILWAMKEGIHVFGSASMGALRAAELDAFGMVGVGRIFESFRDGFLEDDDEVAVAHAGPADGFTCFSEAMVNIRSTLAYAVEQGVILGATSTALIDLAKASFYPDRTWAGVFAAAAAQGQPRAELDALAEWLPVGRIDQKSEDARTMLRVMAEHLNVSRARKRVSYNFEHTALWEAAKDQADAASRDRLHGRSREHDDILDEVRLDPASYPAAAQAGLLRMVTIEEARRRGASVTSLDRKAITDEFRWKRQLFDSAAVEAWASQNALLPEDFARLMEDEGLRRRMEALAEPQRDAYLLDHLRVSGAYVALAERARQKNTSFRAAGVEHLSWGDVGVTEDGVLRWYFEERLGQRLPDDLAGYARDAGFGSVHAFRRAILREYCFVTGALPNAGPSDP